MSDHYDALETRDPAEREADLFGAPAGILRRRADGARLGRAHLRAIDPAGRHQPRRRSRSCPCCASPSCRACRRRPALRRLRRRAAGRVRAPLRLARADLRARGPRRRSVARRARALCRRLPGGRCRAQHLQLSPDAGRFHPRFRRARAGLRGHPGGPRQHRAAARPRSSTCGPSPIGHAGLPEDPARRGRRGRQGRVLDQAGRWSPARPSRHRCGTNSRAAASRPTRPMPRPISASSPMRRRPAKAGGQRGHSSSRSCGPARAIPCRRARSARSS